jgi:hypothetical protein
MSQWLGKRALMFALVLGLSASEQAGAQTIQAPFDAYYSYFDLADVPGLPSRYGGLTFKLGNPNVLLVGGNANVVGGGLYAIDLVRGGDNHITGFTGSATLVADAAYNDGGIAYGPGNVLFLSRWPANELGQIKPGSNTTNKVINLGALGVEYSHAALNFVPGGFLGAGKMKLVSWSGGAWYDAQYAPDGTGTYDVLSVTEVTASRNPYGPEGFFYVPPLSPGFPNRSLMISEYNYGSIGAYEVDANGDPIISSRRVFMSGLTGAEGATVDPLTGDLLFTTFGGGDRIVVVRGFIPEIPGDFDVDGDVDGADFVIWQTNFPKASGAVLQTGDADNDGDVDGADFVVWQTHFPTPAGPGSVPVPEPSAWCLAAMCAACLWQGVRKRHNA